MKAKFTLFALLLFALGCSKSNAPAPSAICLISQIERISGSNTLTTTFEYDTENKLIKFRRGSDTYEYIWESGFVKSVQLNGSKIEDWIYSNGKLSQIGTEVTINSNGQPTELYGNIYTYGSNGNVLTETCKGCTAIYYQYSDYDTNPNPYKILAASVNLSFFPVGNTEGGGGPIATQFLGRSGCAYANNNHRQRSESTGSPRSRVYTYNAKGQVTSIIESVSGGVETTYSITYLNCD